MESLKKGVDDAMPFLLLGSVLLMNILLITGMMKMFFGWDTTLLAGVIAFIGAILGGSITLIGVQKTINSNESLRFKNQLPEKIYHLERVIEIIQKTLINYESVYEGLVEVSETMELEYNDNYYNIIVETPKLLSEELVFVDTNAYRLSLKFREEIARLEDVFDVLHSNLEGIKEDNHLELFTDDSGEQWIGQWKTEETYFVYPNLGYYTLKGFRDFEKLLNGKNIEFSLEVKRQYEEMLLKIELKHEKLIKTIDY